MSDIPFLNPAVLKQLDLYARRSLFFDDLKTIEASLFVKSVLERKQYAPSASDCYSAAECVAAAKRSIATGSWQKVIPVNTNRTTKGIK